jgi:hypothetical protein
VPDTDQYITGESFFNKLDLLKNKSRLLFNSKQRKK